ncbi:MAG: hypothetical protein KC736_01455 [Candidatus Moranbacteria bacterium]|nr:hypothetical protein [Candidatus Moranbacteria bacterium]
MSSSGPDFSDPLPIEQIESTCVVGGCSGQPCVSSDDVLANGGIVTTCEYREEYRCDRSAQCERQESGECGWVQTDSLEECLERL